MKKSPRRHAKKPAKSINRIYIDQSGKVEYTNKQTVVAYSNGRNKALFISSISKKKIQKVFRDAGKPDLFVYKTFAILIYLLIKEDINKLSIITIDREYTSKESLIKKYLLEIIRKGGHAVDPNDIHFAEIGKHSPAHTKAINTYRKRTKPELIIKDSDILKWIV